MSRCLESATTPRRAGLALLVAAAALLACNWLPEPDGVSPEQRKAAVRDICNAETQTTVPASATVLERHQLIQRHIRDKHRALNTKRVVDEMLQPGLRQQTAWLRRQTTSANISPCPLADSYDQLMTASVVSSAEATLAVRALEEAAAAKAKADASRELITLAAGCSEIAACARECLFELTAVAAPVVVPRHRVRILRHCPPFEAAHPGSKASNVDASLRSWLQTQWLRILPRVKAAIASADSKRLDAAMKVLGLGH